MWQAPTEHERSADFCVVVMETETSWKVTTYRDGSLVGVYPHRFLAEKVALRTNRELLRQQIRAARAAASR